MINKRFSLKTQRTQIVSRASERYLTKCRGCGKTVDLVTVAEAGEIAGLTIDEIINRAAKGALHLAVRPEAMLVCLDSLLASGFSLQAETFACRADGLLNAKMNC